MIKFLRAETVGNFDNYFFNDQKQLSTKEVTVTVDFDNEAITGDCVAYGDWYDLDYEECIHYLQQLQESEVIRDFKGFL